MNANLFVGNVDFNVTEQELRDAFGAHGTVLEAKVMTDRVTGKPRGFAFVTMSTPDEAQAAIKALNGTSLKGRNLTVNEARPKEERPGGGYGGGRDRGRPGQGGGRDRRQ